MRNIHLLRNNGHLEGVLELPSSKSISNRVLLIKELSGRYFHIDNLSTADDTTLMNQILEYPEKLVNTGNAGTVMRFLTAFFANKEGEWELIGSERMKSRPIKELVEVLRSLGADIEYLGNEGFPPIRINGKALVGGKCSINAEVSSQFISALLLIAPSLEKGLEIKMEGSAVSFPYVAMTLRLMKYFGVKANVKRNMIKVDPQKYKPKRFLVETDWSAASYIYALVSMSESANVEILGLKKKSLQGDSILCDIMQKFGVKTKFKRDRVILSKKEIKINKFEYNFVQNPDLIPTFATLCTVLKVPFHFRGINALRYKESDRVQALNLELEKLGLKMKVAENEMIGSEFFDTEYDHKVLNTYSDHRLAMSFAIAAATNPNLVIQDSDVVSKSYPDFWADLEKIGLQFGYLAE
jgi:3-phosphoshikimate 1-carboxyvinyltransferase